MGSLWALSEHMVDGLLRMTACAFTGRLKFPFVEGAGCFSNLGPCSVKRCPVLSLEIRSCRQVFCRALDGFIWDVIPFTPIAEAAGCRQSRFQSFYCSNTLPRFESALWVCVTIHWMSWIGFLPVLLSSCINVPSNMWWGDACSSVVEWQRCRP